MSSREQIVLGISNVVSRSEELAAGLSEAQWSRPAYEQGWNARQILAHIAAMGSVSPVFVSWAKNPPPASSGGSGGAPDPDAWNAQQVSARDGKSVAELLAEIRAGHQAGIQALESVTDEQLQATVTLLGHTESAGTLLHVFLVDHSLGHLEDLSRAAGA